MSDIKERPILFSGAMVRALLAGTKTQTRRVAPIADLNIKLHSDDLVTWGVSFTKPVKGVLGSHSGGRFSDLQARSIIASQFNPYGQPGDRLWVRESGAKMAMRCPEDPEQPLIFRHDEPATRSMGHYWVQRTRAPGASYSTECTRAEFLRSPSAKAVPSIHMPRWASRITLEITGVRVERLQDISEADAQAEGIPVDSDGHAVREHDSIAWGSARTAYSELWESLGGAGSWDANPWVWVIEFRRIES